MKKFIRSICNLLLVLGLLVPTFMSPFVLNVDAADNRTIKSILADIEKQKKELQENKNKQKLTNEQILTIKNNISLISNEITKGQNEIIEINNQIAILENQIEEKDAEMKKVINFLQLSDGESQYLEYIFGATSFTDFIYRVAISEQLTKYNENLIDEFNKKIEESKKKQEDMRKRQEELAVEQSNLKNKMSLLGQELQNLDSVGMDIEDSIEYQKEVIELYISKGCNDNEDIATCGRKILPRGTAFFRPTERGLITSEWGPRDLLGRSWHEGIDVGVSVGTPVFAVANGMVAGVVRYNCGGNMVVIHHNINGYNYTTVYAHLSAVNVGDGQTVDRNTIVGYSGGSAGGYDQCTTGPHLHVTVATGLFWVDYYDWTYELNVQYSINPRSVINFPSGLYNSWDDRITAY